MIRKISLLNFKGFLEHTANLKKRTVIVGANNAGKSTLVEALRIIANANRILLSGKYYSTPDWCEHSLGPSCVEFHAEDIGLYADNLFYGNGEAPAVISCELTTGSKLSCEIGSGGQIIATGKNKQGKIFNKKRLAAEANIPRVRILPQLSPVRRRELLLKHNTVKTGIDTQRLSIHFRNQCYFNQEIYDSFKSRVEETWPGIQIQTLERDNNSGDSVLKMITRYHDYVGELANMGHGLQMWLQMIWFITYFERKDVIVLDEPDVYMHPDLQRKILRTIVPATKQVILTTHSIEIMNEVEPKEIMVVNRTYNASKYCPSIEEVQKAAVDIGSIHNLVIARMLESNKFLFVEGNDLKILEKFWKALYPNSKEKLSDIPFTDVGGWGGWQRVVALTKHWRHVKQEELHVVSIFDRDYHTEIPINDRIRKGRKINIEVVVWDKKEIENYLCIPELFHRTINQGREEIIRIEEIEEIINLCAKELYEKTLDSIADSMEKDDIDYRKLQFSTKRSKATQRLEKLLENKDLVDVVPGKSLLSRIIDRIQKKYAANTSISKLISNLIKSDVDRDIKDCFKIVRNEVY